MAKFEYAIPDDLSESERHILDAKRSACFDSIHGVSLRWIHVTDDRGRSIFRLTNYSRPTECYFEATIGQIDTLDDHNFKTQSSLMKGLAPTMNRSLFLVSVCFCLILAGCSGSQTTTTNLAGTWQNEDDDGTNVITFHSDGTFGGTFNTGSWGIFTPTKVMMSGNWSLDGEQIKYTIKKSSYMNEELSGQIYTDTIMSFENNTLVLRDESSGENKLSMWIRR